MTGRRRVDDDGTGVGVTAGLESAPPGVGIAGPEPPEPDAATAEPADAAETADAPETADARETADAPEPASTGSAPEPSSPAEEDDAPAARPDPRSTEIIRVNQPSEALPALARATASAWLRAAAWGVGTTLRLGAQVVRAATDPTAATALYSDLSQGVRNYAREFLGITELEHELGRLVPRPAGAEAQLSDAALRAQGAELLRAAANVGFDESAHPAYARMLSEVAPDEARILRLLMTGGPQPLVDIRQGNLIGLGSQLIAPSLNMLGAQAGLRDRRRVPVYLANLTRLGLVELSDTPLPDPLVYQVLEAQPEVLQLIKETARARTDHRSVRLTALGEDFCAVCLPQPLPELAPGP